MKWNRFTIKTKTDAEDMIICTLAEIGVEGVEIQDHQPLTEEDKAQMFVDIMPEGPADDGIAYLNFYLEEDADKETILKDVRAALEDLRTFMDIGEGTIEESWTEDKDWINNWKEFFHQFYVDDILIVPSWEEVKDEDKDKMILHIDPGTAFGTGMHETTQLVIRQLKKYVTRGAEILDVGTGSGILGITALKLGAGHVVGTDLDPCAVSAVQDNKEANQIPNADFDMMIGNIIDDQEVQNQVGYERYDIVAANILADVLVPLTPVIVHQMKKGAYYITSGILDVKEEVVKASRTGSRAYSGRSYTSGRMGLRNSKKGLKPLMQRFFVEPYQIDEETNHIHINGTDVNHIANVLRMKTGEELWISDGGKKEYRCTIESVSQDEVLLHIIYAQEPNYELPSRLYLFQGLPKADKMELIIQKAVELGAYEVIPVETKRCVVKLDGKKAAKKVDRWQQIAESAAKQSKRMLIPNVHQVLTFKEALKYAESMDIRLIPYELARGMLETKEILSAIQPGQSVGIFIGPEGGFEEKEVETAISEGVKPITLGRRILRTETAGLAILSVLMFQLENQ